MNQPFVTIAGERQKQGSGIVSNVNSVKDTPRECEECGYDINPRRVQALPNVKYCIQCQQDMEKDGRYRPHRMDVQAKLKCGEVDSMESTIVRGG